MCETETTKFSKMMIVFLFCALHDPKKCSAVPHEQCMQHHTCGTVLHMLHASRRRREGAACTHPQFGIARHFEACCKVQRRKKVVDTLLDPADTVAHLTAQVR